METTIDKADEIDTITNRSPGMYRRLLRSQYLKHNVLLLVANVLTGVFAYLLHFVLARLMGVSGYGTVAALIALSAVLLTPVQVASTVASRFASSLSSVGSFGQLNDLIRRLTAILLPLGIGVTVVFIACSTYVAAFFHVSSSSGILLLGLIFTVSFAIPVNLGVLQGLQRFGWFATVTLLPLFLRLVLASALVLLGLGVNGAVLGIVLATVLTYLTSFQPLGPILRGAREHIPSLRSIWSYSVIAATAAMGTVLYYNMDTVLARHFLTAHDAGLYAALATVGRTVLFISSSVGVVMFPKVAALHERDEYHAHILLQALLGVVLLSAAVEIVFWLDPSLVVRILFGAKYLDAAAHLSWYGLGMLLLSVAQVLVSYFLAVGNRLFVWLLMLCCALQAAFISVHHQTITQIVQDVVAADAVLATVLLVTFAVGLRGKQRATFSSR